MDGRSMDERMVMDRWTEDGWLDGWMGWWVVNAWMDRWWTGGWMGEHMNKWMVMNTGCING